MATATTPTEVGGLTELVIQLRDRSKSRSDRDMLADVCNTLSAYRKRLEADERARELDRLCEGA